MRSLKSILAIALISAVGLIVTACNPNTLALVDAIVASLEIAVPTFDGLSPADNTIATNIANGSLTVLADLTNSPISAASIGQAVADFAGKVLPQIKGSDAAVQAKMSVVVSAIENFLKALQAQAPVGQPVSLTPATAIKLAKVAPQINAKQQALRVRISALQTRLAK